MKIVIFDNITNKEKADAIEKLIKQSSPSQDFFLLVVLSVVMASIGLLMNNVAVIIGSMLIAPVLFPILGIAMGVVMVDRKLIGRSFGVLLKSFIIAVVASAVVTLFMYPYNEDWYLTSEILLRINPGLQDAVIALIAGPWYCYFCCIGSSFGCYWYWYCSFGC